MKLKTFLLAFLVVLSTVLPAFATEKESAYDRVMRTEVLRCGYDIYPPFLDKDIKTGKIKGIYPDIFNEIGRQAGLKIEWAEETTPDTMFTSMAAGRFDMLCNPLTHTIARAKVAEFTSPFIYVPFYVYVRANETRFKENSYERLNNKNVTFVIRDGDFTAALTKELFPDAKVLSFVGMTDVAQLMLAVTTGKADAIVGEPIYAGVFIQNNPGKIKKVDAPPLRVAHAEAAVPVGEEALKAFINTSLSTLIESGFTEKTIAKYVSNKNDLLFPAKPYEVSK